MNDTDKRKSIYELQTMLLTLSRAYGLPRVIPDGIYGSETRDAVAEFQKSAGLTVTGVVDFATWNALYEAYENTEKSSLPPRMISPFDTYNESGVLRRNDKFPTIYIVQAMLEELSRLYEFEQ